VKGSNGAQKQTPKQTADPNTKNKPQEPIKSQSQPQSKRRPVFNPRPQQSKTNENVRKPDTKQPQQQRPKDSGSKTVPSQQRQPDSGTKNAAPQQRRPNSGSKTSPSQQSPQRSPNSGTKSIAPQQRPSPSQQSPQRSPNSGTKSIAPQQRPSPSNSYPNQRNRDSGTKGRAQEPEYSNNHQNQPQELSAESVWRPQKAPHNPRNGGFECVNEGFFRDPNDCNKFYRCNRNPFMNKFEFRCAEGLHFDEDLSVCNWPSQLSTPCGSGGQEIPNSRVETEPQNNYYSDNNFNELAQESRQSRRTAQYNRPKEFPVWPKYAQQSYY
jgi:hypothetical protein